MKQHNLIPVNSYFNQPNEGKTKGSEAPVKLTTFQELLGHRFCKPNRINYYLDQIFDKGIKKFKTPKKNKRMKGINYGR